METKTVRIKVFPNSKKEKIIVIDDESFEIYVREPAQNNLANRRVRECVAEHYSVPLKNTVIQTGHRSRKKTIIITSEKV